MGNEKNGFGIRVFWRGFLAGVLFAGIIFGFISVLVYSSNREKMIVKEFTEYAEKQKIIEELQEDYSNRAVDEFLEIPGVRGAADGAAAEFERKRDEIVHRFRNRLAD